MNGQSVAGPASSSAPAPAATERADIEEWNREASRKRPRWCRDRQCRLPLTQSEKGRPRRYCDATCRKNAERERTWDAYLREHAAWRERQAQADRLHQAAMKVWEALPYVPEPDWMETARQHGWTPPPQYRRVRPVPAPTRTVHPEPAPPAGSRPRSGTKGQAWWS